MTLLYDTLYIQQRRVCDVGCLPASLHRDGHCNSDCPQIKQNIKHIFYYYFGSAYYGSRGDTYVYCFELER